MINVYLLLRPFTSFIAYTNVVLDFENKIKKKYRTILFDETVIEVLHIELFLKYIMSDSFKIICNEKRAFFQLQHRFLNQFVFKGTLFKGNRR